MVTEPDYKEWITDSNKAYYGADTFFFEELGYVSYRIKFVDNVCYVETVFFYARKHGRTLFRNFEEYLVRRGVKFLIGVVAMDDGNTEKNVAIFLYYGCKIISADYGVIKVKKVLVDEKDWGVSDGKKIQREASKT